MLKSLLHRLLFLFLALPAIMVVQQPVHGLSQPDMRQQAINWFLSGEFEKALPVFSRLAYDYPYDYLLKYYLGATLVESGEYGMEAEKNLVLSMSHDVPARVFFYLGVINHSRNDWNGAQRYYNRFRNNADSLQVRELDIAGLTELCYREVNPFKGAGEVIPPEFQTEAVAVAESEAVVEAVAVAEPEAVTEAVAVIEPEAVTEAVVVTEPEAVPEAVAVAEPEAVPEAVVVTEPEAVAEAVVVTEPEAVPEAVAVTEPEVVAEAVVVTEPEALTEAAVVTEAEAVTEAVAVIEPEAVTEAVAVAEPEALTGAERGLDVSGPDIGTGSDEGMAVSGDDGPHFIHFQINGRVTYLTEWMFQVPEALEEFQAAEKSRSKLGLLMENTDQWRQRYGTTMRPDVRDSLARLIREGEQEAVLLKREVDDRFRKAATLENEWWADADYQVYDRYSTVYDSLKELRDRPPVLLDGIEELLLGEADSDAGPPVSEDDEGEAREEKSDEDQIVYKVQLGAYARTVPAARKALFDKIAKIRVIDTYENEEGATVYTTGNMTDYNGAVKLMNQVRQEGVKDAFVIALKSGKRVSLPQH